MTTKHRQRSRRLASTCSATNQRKGMIIHRDGEIVDFTFQMICSKCLNTFKVIQKTIWYRLLGDNALASLNSVTPPTLFNTWPLCLRPHAVVTNHLSPIKLHLCPASGEVGFQF